MKTVSILPTTLMALALTSTLSVAQPRPDLGRFEFVNSCAACHGIGAKGDGPMARQLTRAPSDLTALAKRNGGVFPSGRVFDTIDGRASLEILYHGTRDMPVWGNAFIARANMPGDAAMIDPEWYARARVTALADYLWRIQEK
jgi:mono/diheme cytochrome c family protein